MVDIPDEVQRLGGTYVEVHPSTRQALTFFPFFRWMFLEIISPRNHIYSMIYLLESIIFIKYRYYMILYMNQIVFFIG